MNSAAPTAIPEARRFYLICTALIAATLLAYWNVWQFDYVNYDDPNNIYQNPVVLSGLNGASLFWGLTTSYFEYWHPVTWWSHMLDSELFGAAAGGRHLMNLGLHLANTILVFVWLRRMTGTLWRSAIVAALFALHPMQVESVAWLSERKDVLAAFFGLLTLLAYARFVQSSNSVLPGASTPISRHFQSRPYCWALCFFALALMSKPTVVTWPFVMLLLDVWPLRRVPSVASMCSFHALKGLLVEKVPFLVLTILSSVISYVSLKGQAGKVLDGVDLSLAFRLTNVPVSYARYLGKLFWPDDLAVLYPLPSGLWPWWQIVGSVTLLVLISVLVWRWSRQNPALLIGWLIFLGVLVPASGIVGVGLHAMADRFTYLPSLGLFVAVVWGAAELLGRRSVPLAPLAVIVVVALLALGITCRHQVQHWRNSESLWTHCLSVNSENAVAHYNLGHVLHHSGRAEPAVPHYEEAIRIMPKHLDAPLNLGAISYDRRDYVAATNYFQRALAIKPTYGKALLNLGMALNELQDFRAASNYLAQAVATEPNNLQLRCVYAFTLNELGLAPAALEQATAALQLSPNYGIALALLGRAHAVRGERALAQSLFAQAVVSAPEFAELHLWSGLEFMHAGDMTAAMSALETAVRLKPESVAARSTLAAALVSQSRVVEGLAQYRAALKLAPDSPAVLNNLAWLLSTTSQPELRDGAAAVRFAQRACELTQSQHPLLIGTLAAAYAEAGQFSEAVAAATKAIDVATATGQSQVAARNAELLLLYRSGKPYHESAK